MIYKFCLVPGLIYPLITEEFQRVPPGLPLLRTCKAILDEAGYELYKNTFVVSDWVDSDHIYDACLRYPERRPMLKSLELRFSNYELNAPDRDEIRKDVEEEYPPEAFQQFGSQASDEMESVRKEERHLRLKDRLRVGLWRDKMFHILDDTRLEHLRLNLDECWCDSRCCTLDYSALWTFAPEFARVLPKRLEFGGKLLPETDSLIKDWVQITTFGTMTRMRGAPVEQDMIKQLEGWDFDSFMENVTNERKLEMAEEDEMGNPL